MDKTFTGIPVILDTDIGTDIDDTWALALLLRMPELDLRLVTTAHGDTAYRANLAAKFLDAAGRSDVPVAAGPPTSDARGPQEAWIDGYDPASHAGGVRSDGVDAMIETIRSFGTPEARVTVISIGPMTNLAAALARDPSIAGLARIVGMQGSVYRGYGGAPRPAAEYNVVCDPAACRAVFAAPWRVTLTPVDTCGLVTLEGERFRRVRNGRSPLACALTENVRLWASHHAGYALAIGEMEASSTLFDTVAVWMAFDETLLEIREIGLRVEDDGRTKPEQSGPKVRCALEWKDLEGFKDRIAGRLSDG
jgi:inosine-uridine nucleoside N-ribohydrolase